MTREGLWNVVCAASFVRQYSREHERTADPPIEKAKEYMGEAMSVADLAIESFIEIENDALASLKR